mmetsp:Transcript_14196/g.20066  ORF Transcript_14196/g.20066 Transcript_14196/m.20066 type:complete len:139 (-) Transcript_14196:13-429(-)
MPSDSDISCTDEDALKGLQLLSESEGIIPALETAHAVFGACERAKTMSPDKHIVINLSGRGDKDMESVAQAMGVKLGVTSLSETALNNLNKATAEDKKALEGSSFWVGKNAFVTQVQELKGKIFKTLEEYAAYMKGTK